MTQDIRDAYACAIEGWVQVPGAGFERLYEPCRPWQYRIIDGQSPEPASDEVHIDSDSQIHPDHSLGWRAIPRRNSNPEQLDLI